MNATSRGTVEMTAAMLISGTIGWLVVMSGEPVTGVVFWRCFFGAITLAIVCVAMGLFQKSVISNRQILFCAFGGAAIVLNWLLLFAAYSYASISIATAVYNTQPFMLAGLGALFFAEKLTAAKLTWLGIAFGGVLLIVQAKRGGDGNDYLVGIAMALGAAFFYAIAAIVAKALRGVPPHLIALIQVLTGCVMLAPAAASEAMPAGLDTWALLVTVGCVHTGLMYILLYGAIQKLPTSLVGALSFIYPIVAIMVDHIAFGHRLQPLQIVGAAAILIAAAGMMRGWSLWRQRREPATTTPR
jgi:drug/metabolite transporter (DMT)-like permease